MKLTEQVTVECCGLSRTYAYKYEAVHWLMGHIRRTHKSVLRKIEREGRALARSQNGLGYYDGSDKDTGWRRARPTFREAWRENALEALLEKR